MLCRGNWSGDWKQATIANMTIRLGDSPGRGSGDVRNRIQSEIVMWRVVTEKLRS